MKITKLYRGTYTFIDWMNDKIRTIQITKVSEDGKFFSFKETDELLPANNYCPKVATNIWIRHLNQCKILKQALSREMVLFQLLEED